MDRSGPECATDADLAAGLSAASRDRSSSKLTLVQADVAIGNHLPEEAAAWRLPSVKILNDHLETASTAWQAYRAPTPQDWFNLLSKDFSVLPQLRQAVYWNCSKNFPWRDRAWRDGNADAGADIGRQRGSFRCLSRPQKAQRTARVRLLGGRSAAGRAGSLSGARRVRSRRGAVHAGDARRPQASRAIQTKQTVKLTALGKAILAGARISAGTTRSIAGGAAPN